MNIARRRSLWLVLGTLICILLVGAVIARAQSTPTSIPIGQNQSSTLTSGSSTSQFAVMVTAPQNIIVEVLATSPGFTPAFRVLDPNNAVIFDEANATAQNIIQDQVTLASPGTYVIEVRSANNAAGQFTISIQPGAPFNPPTPLPMEQLISATVDPQNPRKVFSFTALTTDALFVEAASTIPTSGPVIRLIDADTNEDYGLANAHLTLGRFRMPIGTTNYLLEVTHSGSTFPETVTICLWPEHGQPCAGNGNGSSSGTGSENPTAVPTQSACACQATVTGRVNVNIRGVPPPQLSIIVGHLPPNTPAQVIGETPDHSWIEISYNGIVGWVSANLVALNNFCDNIPIIPVTPQPTPTRGRGGLPTIPPRVTDTPQLPPPPQPSATPSGPCLSVAACPPTPTSSIHLMPQPSLVFHPPTPTPTRIIIR